MLKRLKAGAGLRFGSILAMAASLLFLAPSAYPGTVSIVAGGNLSLRPLNTFTGNVSVGLGGDLSLRDSRASAITLTPSPGNVITSTPVLSLASSGLDGIFHPTQSINLDLVPAAVFNFSTITIDSNVSVGFNRNGSNVPIYFLATGDIVIDGALDGGSGLLYLSTPGTITLHGNLFAQELSLSGNQLVITGNTQLVSVPIPASGGLLAWALGAVGISRLSYRQRRAAGLRNNNETVCG